MRVIPVVRLQLMNFWIVKHFHLGHDISPPRNQLEEKTRTSWTEESASHIVRERKKMPGVYLAIMFLQCKTLQIQTFDLVC